MNEAAFNWALIPSFLAALERRCPPIELRSALDHRRLKRAASIDDVARTRSWYLPSERDAFERAVAQAASGKTGAPRSLSVYGRELRVPWAVDGIARFSFAELCEAVRH